MGDFWEDTLQPAKLGQTEIPIQNLNRGGGRRTARHRYNYRDGQDVEDIGRAPLTWTIVVPLFRGMKDIIPGLPLYPDTYDLLRVDLDDPFTLGETEFVDPELGPVPVKVISHAWMLKADTRNGGVFTIKLEERSFEPFVFTLGAIVDEELASATFAEEIDANIPFSENTLLEAWLNAGIQIDFAFTQGELWTGLVDGYFDTIEQSVLLSDEVAAHIDTVRARIDVALQFESLQTADQWSTYEVMVRLSDTLTEAGKRVLADTPRLIEFTVPWRMSHFQIAVLLYSDVTRASEILRRNSIQNPLFIEVGTVLLVSEV